jgi:hypothetical protein
MSEETTQDGWDTEEAGGFIKFEEEGAGFTGLLTAYEKKNTAKGEAHNYTVITKNGTQTFYAPKDLHDKLSGVAIKYPMGTAIIKVEFEKKIKTASGNDFKIFDVKHKKSTPEDLAAFGINGDGSF